MGDVLFAALLGTMIGAKLYYVLDRHAQHSRSLESRRVRVLGRIHGIGGALRARRSGTRSCRSSASPTSPESPSPRDTPSAAPDAGRSATTTASRTAVRSPSRFPQGAPPSTVAEMRHAFHVRSRRAPNPSDVVSVYPTQLFEVGDGHDDVRHPLAHARSQARRGLAVRRVGVLAGIERFIVEFFRAKDDRFCRGRWA